jgi:SAM-dependent methyltransferase
VNRAEYDALFAVEDRHWWFRGVRREVARALSRFGPQRKEGVRWLDTGSGTGGLLANLGRAGPLRLAAGLDLSWDGLLLSKRRGLPALARASASRLPFPDGSFEAVTSIDVLCHREVDAAAALSEAARCLAPGGVLVLQVPAYPWLYSTHDRAVWSSRRFTRAEVTRMVESAGFTIRRCGYRNSLLFPLAAARRLLSRRGAEGSERSDVAPAGPAVQAAGTAALRLEEGVARLGLRLPFGLSVFCVAAR